LTDSTQLATGGRFVGTVVVVVVVGTVEVVVVVGTVVVVVVVGTVVVVVVGLPHCAIARSVR
jgi:hypothetical protein